MTAGHTGRQTGLVSFTVTLEHADQIRPHSAGVREVLVVSSLDTKSGEDRTEC